MIYQIKSKYNFSKPQRTPTCTNRTTNFYKKKTIKQVNTQTNYIYYIKMPKKLT